MRRRPHWSFCRSATFSAATITAETAGEALNKGRFLIPLSPSDAGPGGGGDESEGRRGTQIRMPAPPPRCCLPCGPSPASREMAAPRGPRRGPSASNVDLKVTQPTLLPHPPSAITAGHPSSCMANSGCLLLPLTSLLHRFPEGSRAAGHVCSGTLDSTSTAQGLAEGSHGLPENAHFIQVDGNEEAVGFFTGPLPLRLVSPKSDPTVLTLEASV